MAQKVPARKPGYSATVEKGSALQTLLPHWQDLCDRALEDNVYYTPHYAQALFAGVEKPANVDFALAWDEDRLVGLLPVTRPRVPVPLLQPDTQAWQTKYTFNCMPLLDRNAGVRAASALLDALTDINAGIWLLPTVNVEGRANRAMIEALEARGLSWCLDHHFERASLEASGTFEEHMKAHVPAKRRRELTRNRRRLEELGKVEHRAYDSGEDLREAIHAFLDIEASGWKGQRGTALACRKDTKLFALEAFCGEPGHTICRADVLTLDDKPIAVSLVVFAGTTGFTVKCAYDETYRRYSAGLLLEVEVIRSLLEERWADRLDSATAGSHVIDFLWPGRTKVADLLFSMAPGGAQTRLSLVCQTNQAATKTKLVLKETLKRVGMR